MAGKFSTGPRPDQEQTAARGGAAKLRSWETPGKLIDKLHALRYAWWISMPGRPNLYLSAHRDSAGVYQVVCVATAPGTMQVAQVKDIEAADLCGRSFFEDGYAIVRPPADWVFDQEEFQLLWRLGDPA